MLDRSGIHNLLADMHTENLRECLEQVIADHEELSPSLIGMPLNVRNSTIARAKDLLEIKPEKRYQLAGVNSPGRSWKLPIEGVVTVIRTVAVIESHTGEKVFVVTKGNEPPTMLRPDGTFIRALEERP